MKKHVTKSNIMFLIIGIIIGSIGIVIADTIHSNEVLYDNSNSSSSATDVQEALNDVYSIIDHNSLGFSLLVHNPDGLSTELVGGLYRYQGIQDNSHNVNNYICFATTSKSDCVSDTDKYMYRIIGINASGQMKLIKKEALNDSTSGLWSGTEWPNSGLFTKLNGSSFLTNITYVPDSTWSNRISHTDWHYTTFSDANTDASTIYINEITSPTVNSKIGLLYLHDYFYGLQGGNNCSNSGVPTTCATSWIHLSKNDSLPPNGHEWIITRYNNNGLWTIKQNGSVNYLNTGVAGYSSSVRPVFFLKATEIIASGSGTITDPYILS